MSKKNNIITAIILSAAAVLFCIYFLDCPIHTTYIPDDYYIPTPEHEYEENKAACLAYIRDNADLLDKIIACLDRYDHEAYFDGQGDTVKVWQKNEKLQARLEADAHLLTLIESLFENANIYNFCKIHDTHTGDYMYLMEFSGIQNGYATEVYGTTDTQHLEEIYDHCEHITGNWYYVEWTHE